MLELVAAAGVVLLVGIPLSLGGLVLLRSTRDVIDFRKRGYRVRRIQPKELVRWTLGPKECVYEERDPDGSIRALPFVRIVVELGYPARSEIVLPEELRWNDDAPAWARGRRAQIVERIVDALGTETHVRERA